MPGGGDDGDLQPADPHGLPVGQVVVTGTDRADRCRGLRREVLGRLGVVLVVMGQERQRDPGASGLDEPQHRLEVLRVQRPRVDDDGVGGPGFEEDPGVRALEGHRAGVRSEHAVRAVAHRSGTPAVTHPATVATALGCQSSDSAALRTPVERPD